MVHVKIQTVILGAILIITLFVEMNMDWSIDLGDSLLVILLTLFACASAAVYMLHSLLNKKWHQAGLCVVLVLSIITGSCAGMRITGHQFRQARTYAESLTREIHRQHEKIGSWPVTLDGIPGYSGVPTVNIGFLRKRPLIYAVRKEEDGFILQFPYRIALVARYDSRSGEWYMDD